tara:strand:- start:241 stop:1059 length:819 start_codon:yes stop_codon:yes gene_type:complete
LNKFPVCPIFIPANRLEWVEKTFNKGTDAVIIDLEDSVPKEQKDDTRTNLLSYLDSQDFDKTILVRVNPVGGECGKDDMKALSEVSSKIDAFMLPKIEEADVLNGLPDNLIALIETPKSIQNLEEIASHKNVIGIALGGADLSASLGSDMSWDSLLFTRSKIILEAAVNNLFTIDSPFMNIEDISSLENESVLSNGLGFDGKAAIHPDQIETITKSFLPNEADIQEAKEIIKLFNSSSEAVIAYKGKMIDMPIVLSMEKRLRLVGIDPKNID